MLTQDEQDIAWIQKCAADSWYQNLIDRGVMYVIEETENKERMRMKRDLSEKVNERTGRELDAFLERWIFGRIPEWRNDTPYRWIMYDRLYFLRVPEYSTNKTDSADLVEKLRRGGYEIQTWSRPDYWIRSYGHRHRCYIRWLGNSKEDFSNPPILCHIETGDDILELAIAHAAEEIAEGRMKKGEFSGASS